MNFREVAVVVALASVIMTIKANATDDENRVDRHHSHARAADLAECCTPGDR